MQLVEALDGIGGSGPGFMWSARSSLPPKLLAELDQVTMVLKSDPGLLDVAAAGKLPFMDTFSLVGDHLQPGKAEEPSDAFMEAVIKNLPAILKAMPSMRGVNPARLMAERFYESFMLDQSIGSGMTPSVETLERMAEACCRSAQAFARVADAHFSENPSSGESNAG